MLAYTSLDLTELLRFSTLVNFIKPWYNVINVQHKCPKGMQLICAINFYGSPKLFKTKVPVCQFAGVGAMQGG